MEKLVIICGPTATGKTALAIKLAKKFNGEIISADSRQVYRGMDIGTGKDLPKSAKLKVKSEKLHLKIKSWGVLKPYRFNKIPVWLLDVVEPDKEFSVADYYKLAWKVIKDIWQRGETPFLVGGTGFYIKAVIEEIESLGIEPDWELRKRLSDKDIKILSEELKKLDPKRWERMNESDRKNPRRLIRAIEIAKWRKEKAHYDTALYHSKKREVQFQPLFIGLTAPYKISYERIDERVEKRVKEGIVEEIEGLLERGYGWDLPSLSGHGYGEWRPYFEGKQSLEETIQRWKYDEHGYARRQMSWFRKDHRVYWFDITLRGWENDVLRVCKRAGLPELR